MRLEGEQTLLRVHLRNTDKYGLRSAADALIEHARSGDVSGATVLRGILGLDSTGRILESGVFSLVQHEPLVVEVVDAPQVIGQFLSVVDHIIPKGLATLERAHVLVFRHGEQAALKAAVHLQVPPNVADLFTLPSSQEFPMMKLSGEGQLVRRLYRRVGCLERPIAVSSLPSHCLEAKELGLAGATVLRGSMGFGAASRVHASKLLDISTDLPIIVEIVDTAEQIQRLLPFLDECVQEGLITIESVKILKYLSNRTRSALPV